MHVGDLQTCLERPRSCDLGGGVSRADWTKNWAHFTLHRCTVQLFSALLHDTHTARRPHQPTWRHRLRKTSLPGTRRRPSSTVRRARRLTFGMFRPRIEQPRRAALAPSITTWRAVTLTASRPPLPSTRGPLPHTFPLRRASSRATAGELLRWLQARWVKIGRPTARTHGFQESRQQLLALALPHRIKRREAYRKDRQRADVECICATVACSEKSLHYTREHDIASHSSGVLSASASAIAPSRRRRGARAFAWRGAFSFTCRRPPPPAPGPARPRGPRCVACGLPGGHRAARPAGPPPRASSARPRGADA